MYFPSKQKDTKPVYSQLDAQLVLDPKIPSERQAHFSSLASACRPLPRVGSATARVHHVLHERWRPEIQTLHR